MLPATVVLSLNVTMASLSSLSVVTFNMHGFNQGRSTLDHLCSANEVNIDVIFVQEHWLTPGNLDKIKLFSDRYIAYGISAMENVIGNSCLKGRPFGGCCSLVKSNLGIKVNFCKCSERYVALCLDNLLFINVYFPYVAKDSDMCTVQSMFAEIEGIIGMFPKHHILLAGDFNCNIEINSPKTEIFCKFIDKFNVTPCNNIIGSNINFTYFHETLQRSSYIDFICISNSIINDLDEFKVLELPFNISDHLPVYARLAVDFQLHSLKDSCNGASKSSERIQSALRWDHASLPFYYDLTRELLQPVYDRLKSDYSSLMSYSSSHDYYMNVDNVDCSWPAENCSQVNNNCVSSEYIDSMIEEVYDNVISSLNQAADSVIPLVKRNFFKYWWNEELDVLKSTSCSTHLDWVNAGRPKHGPIFDAKRSAKSRYKKCIKDNQKVEIESVSNNLHDALVCKSQSAFWKSWRNKFVNKKITPPIIEGQHDDQNIANSFANYFSDVCTVDNISNTVLHAEFVERLAAYSSFSIDDFCVDVELLDGIINDLGKGKAAGIDRLTAEHLLYCHPIVSSILSMLFNLMIRFEYVPNDFGVGIVVPIPKKDSKSNLDKHADYRGISISPVISKIFELCIVDRIDHMLITSDLQFGFKKGLGCNNAIFAARSTISYCTSNNSTVNLCSLDVAKAFDKVNHVAIYLKLMDRKIPRNIIVLLSKWYNKIFAIVKWNSCFSSPVRLSAGVRQGGVLSPFLFAILVDDILVKLRLSGLGCRVRGQVFNAIMYADDLLLMSISLCDLQSMIILCIKEFNDIGLAINANKTVCMRIGPRFKVPVSKLIIGNLELEWKTEMRFLGVSFLASSVVKCNLQIARQKFFRALNGIFGKIGAHSSTPVTISLINSFCVPLLTYGIESFNVTKSMYSTLESAYSAAFAKIFSTFDKDVIRQCQFFCHASPLCDIIDNRRLKFLYSMGKSNNLAIQFLYEVAGKAELNNVLRKHSLLSCSINSWKHSIWDNFCKSQVL
jgi:exonuclease III